MHDSLAGTQSTTVETTPSPESPGSVLVVDDSRVIRLQLSHILQQSGYDVHEAANGTEALQAAAEHAQEYDLILLDVNMPDLDGYEVCRVLKEDPDTASIPVIYVSSLDEIGDKLMAFETGGVDYITKPFQPGEVLARVNAHITLYQQRRELARLRDLELSVEREKMRLLSDFIRNTSHDLRTPLSVIGTYVHLLKGESDPQRREERARIIQEHIQRLAGMIDELHFMVSLDGDLKIVTSPLDLTALVQVLPMSIENLADEKEIEIAWALPDSAQIVEADESLLHRAFTSILHNALVYTPDGGQVEIRVFDTGRGHIAMEIEDNGIGIDPVELPHIFERFHKANAARTVDKAGSGLGLAIVHRIIELHHGKIEVNSIPGQGSLFRVLLPN